MSFYQITLALFALVATARASPAALAPTLDITSRQLQSFPQGIANAIWDGNCTYPVSDSSFNLEEYIAQPWYQVAASTQIFQLGCECVYAEYAALADASGISVHNYCTILPNAPVPIPSTISGTAVPVPALYGPGAIKVSFPSVPGGGNVPLICQGPNYVVQKLYRDANGELEAAIVSAPLFVDWFVLSRAQNVDQATINTYLSDTAALGNKVSGNYGITTQSGCPAAP